MIMSKKIKVTLLIVLVLLMAGTTVLAASYSFHFIPPFTGSARWATATTVSGSAPYVDPSGTTNGTTYVLVLPAYHSTTDVSNFRTNVTSAKTYFTYNTGYGGSGQQYNLCGFPTATDFQEYYAAGSWLP